MPTKSPRRPLRNAFRTVTLLALAVVATTLASPASARDRTPDLDEWVGRFGVGWYGVRNIPMNPPLVNRIGTVAVPTVGVRHWMSDSMGWDAALGLRITSGSELTRDGDTSRQTDQPTVLAVMLRGGLPLVMDKRTHTAFIVTPQAAIGFGNSTIRAENEPNTTVRGLLLQLGATAGIELFFGFMGLPQLSLDANVGAFIESESAYSVRENRRTRVRETRLTTATGPNPWDILRANVAARYYF